MATRRRSASTGSFGNIRGSSRSTILRGARDVQTGEAMLFERTLPGEKLFLRQLVDTASLLHRDAAAAHGSEHRSFAADHPSLGVRCGSCSVSRVPPTDSLGRVFMGCRRAAPGAASQRQDPPETELAGKTAACSRAPCFMAPVLATAQFPFISRYLTLADMLSSTFSTRSKRASSGP